MLRWRAAVYRAPAGERSKWHIWALSATQAVFYAILDSRSADAARAVLSGYRGVIMTDGYRAYESLRKQGEHFTQAYCWSHVRRAFYDIREHFPQAEQVLELIGALYEVERQCPTGPPGDELRRQLRNEKSRDIIVASSNGRSSSGRFPRADSARPSRT